MRTNQNNKRARGRGRKSHGNNPNRTFDSNGPDVKIRGNASHIYEKYQSLARDANASGDRVGAENYLQHAEHYFRLMAAAQAQSQAQSQPQTQNRENGSDPEAPKEREGRRANGGGRRNGRTNNAATDEEAADTGNEKGGRSKTAAAAAPASDESNSAASAETDEQPAQV